MYSLVKAIKALSDETRIRIMHILAERECCVCEVMQALDISQSRASRNLGILYDAGFLKMRREGLWTLYSLDPSSMPDYLVKLAEAVPLALVDNPVAAEDRARLQKAVRNGVCLSREVGQCEGSNSNCGS